MAVLRATAPAVLALLTVVVPSSPAAAYVLNAVQLDNGTCGQHLQIGSNHTASSTQTPTFLLGGDGGLSSYRISMDGTVVGTFYSDGSGNVCINETTPLSQGPHQLTGQELAPHSANIVTPFNFTVDSVPPPAPSQPVLDPVSDSGTKGDDITNQTAPRLDGTSGPGVLIRLFEDGIGYGGAVANSQGQWSIVTDPLAQGVNVLTAVTVNEAGVQSPNSAALDLEVASGPPGAPPAPTLDPASGSNGVATTATPLIDGTGVAPGESVTVSADGTNAGTTMANGAGNWQVTTSMLAAGQHSVTATATDGAGYVSPPSAALSFSVAPASVPDAPALTATAGDETVTLSWNPSSNGGSAVTSYDIYRGTSSGSETLLGSVTSTNDADSTVTDGTTYYYEVSALNAIGQGPRSTEVSATPEAAGAAPTIMSPSSLKVVVHHGFSFTVVATGDPNPTFSTSGALPKGVTFNTSTGVLAGTPAAGSRGVHKLKITAKNAMGQTVQTLSLKVVAPH